MKLEKYKKGTFCSIIPHKLITYVVIFSMFEIINIFYITSRQTQLKNNHIAEQNILINNVYNAQLDNYREFSEELYEEVINVEPVKNLMYQANIGDTSNKDLYRDSLLNYLSTTFKIIKNLNYKIFHFHTINGESFLRFHKPDFYGDNLLEFRNSIEKVITLKNYVEGFEEGRIENSYRFVRPLFYKNQYIGSVETSIALREFKKEIGKIFEGETKFLLLKDIVNKEGFIQNDSFYLESIFKDYYFYNKANEYDKFGKNHINKEIITDLDQNIIDKHSKELSNRDQFTSLFKIDNKYYLSSFIPIQNIEGVHAAYVVFYQEDKNILSIKNLILKNFLLLTLITFIITLFISFINRQRELAYNHSLALQTAKDKAEESDRLKSAFLANMSHDIRTPLNSIIGFTDLIMNTECTEDEIKEFLNTIQKSGSNLLHLINDIIDYSRIEAGELKVVNIPCDINTKLDELLDIFIDKKARNNKQNVNIYNSKGNPNPNFTVVLDSFRLDQILTNLLDNALKFTSEGSIEFGYNLKENEIIFYVKDTGIGIEKENQPLIFERFRQVHEKTDKSIIGVGLGLAISTQLTKLMKGQLWVESEIGKGSTFYVSLPLDLKDQTPSLKLSENI